MATIDIDGIKKAFEKDGKTADSEFQRLQEKAKVDKEPPFWPEVKENLDKFSVGLVGNVLEKGKADVDDDTFTAAMDSVRTAVQYYTNLLLPPTGKTNPFETAIIAIAAKQVHRMLNSVLAKGTAGEEVEMFYRRLDIFSLGMKGSVITAGAKSGRIRNDQVDAELERVAAEMAEKAAASPESSGEELTKKLFEAIKTVNDGTSKFEGADLPAKFFTKTAADDPAAQAVVDALLACENYWTQRIVPIEETHNDFEVMSLILTLRHIQENLAKQFKSPDTSGKMFKFLETVDSWCIGSQVAVVRKK